MKYLVEHFSFKERDDYLDVEVHYGENWIELKTETSGRFAIQNRNDLDMIYKKLCEVFDSFEEEQKTEYEKIHKNYKG